MADYQLTTLGDTVLRSMDGAYIPVDPGNADYAAYLAWRAAGNTPDPAPTPPRPTQINPGDFLLRFTPTEQSAIQQLAITNGQIDRKSTRLNSSHLARSRMPSSA